MSLASLTAYGSGSDEASDEEARTTLPRQPPDAALALPAPRQGNAGAAVPPDSKRPRRAFQLPLPSAQASEGESSDDEDAKRFAASRKGGGLLASLPAPKNAASQRNSAPPADSSAYDDALARKKNPKQMAAALFEKQLLAKREQVTKASAGSEELQSSGSQKEHGDSGEQAVPEPATVPSAAVEAALPDGWGAVWDEKAKAYYYYNSAGHTQWEPPAAHRSAGAEYHAGQPGVSGPAQPAWEDASLPPELRRELKRQAQRGGGQVPSFVGSAPVVTQQDFWNGEKHQEYTSMASAFHVPMNAPSQLKPGQLAKRKHQITDVLHSAAANELKYLDQAAAGRKSKAQVNSRYGW